jgi:hypothetical protein
VTQSAVGLLTMEWIADCYSDPLHFVEMAFDWGTGELEGHDGPDVWQADVLSTIREHMMSPRQNRALRIAVASGHGVGKSALVAWLILWAMSTRPNLSGVVTANTAKQLETKTWRELAVWHRRLVRRDLFTLSGTKFAAVSQPETWFTAAVPWAKERPEAFAGLHARDVLVIYDEASAIPDTIWEVSEGAMTTPGALWFAFGNPTRTSGRFRQCFGRFRHRWKTIRVDARDTRLASRAQIDEWIADYGEDSDFVRVRVKGEFPRIGSAQFIAPALVDAARRRLASGYGALVMGIDVARFGDDQTVFAFREGDAVKHISRFRGLDTMETAGRAAEAIVARRPDAVFIDGVGVGGGVVDRLRQLGFPIVDINAGARANNERQYANRRVEMWGHMRDWLKAGGCLPADDQALADDLTGPEYSFDAGNRVMLEKKQDMRLRGLASPDAGDALALTFADPVWPDRDDSFAPVPETTGLRHYDPFSW